MDIKNTIRNVSSLHTIKNNSSVEFLCIPIYLVQRVV